MTPSAGPATLVIESARTVWETEVGAREEVRIPRGIAVYAVGLILISASTTGNVAVNTDIVRLAVSSHAVRAGLEAVSSTCVRISPEVWVVRPCNGWDPTALAPVRLAFARETGTAGPVAVKLREYVDIREEVNLIADISILIGLDGETLAQLPVFIRVSYIE